MERLYSKREFIRRAAFTAGLTGSAFFAGCNYKNQPQNYGTDSITTTVSRGADSEASPNLLTPLTEREMRRAAGIAVDAFQKVFEVNLPKNEVIRKTYLVTDKSLYKTILRNALGEDVPSEELDRPGFMADKQIFVFQPAVEKQAGLLLNDPRSRENILVNIVGKELVHYLTSEYEASDDLQSALFSGIVKYQGKRVERGVVNGAVVRTKIDGIKISWYESLEQAEAIVINNFVRAQTKGKPEPALYNQNLLASVKLLENLLHRVGPNYEENIKLLFKLRMINHGREEWMQNVGKTSGAVSERDQMFFSHLIFSAIDIGDQAVYNHWVNK